MTSAAYACASDHCITCADEGVPMTVLDIDADSGLARCRAQDSTLHIVEIGLVDDAAPGTVLLVHAGVAIAALDPDPARVAVGSTGEPTLDAKGARQNRALEHALEGSR